MYSFYWKQFWLWLVFNCIHGKLFLALCSVKSVLQLYLQQQSYTCNKITSWAIRCAEQQRTQLEKLQNLVIIEFQTNDCVIHNHMFRNRNVLSVHCYHAKNMRVWVVSQWVTGSQCFEETSVQRITSSYETMENNYLVTWHHIAEGWCSSRNLSVFPQSVTVASLLAVTV